MTAQPAPSASAGDPCLARRPGLHSRPERAVIERVLVKGYLVRMDTDGMQLKVAWVKPLKSDRRAPARAAEPQSAAQRDALQRRITERNSDPERTSIVRASAVSPPAAPQPKPEAPERCPQWLDMIRKLPCCNCGERAPSDTHHEGRRGVGQKARDTRTAPLCRTCHRVYTDTNCLPRPESDGLLSRDASLAILHGAMLRIFGRVLDEMPAELQVELLSATLARMERGALTRALRVVAL